MGGLDPCLIPLHVLVLLGIVAQGAKRTLAKRTSHICVQIRVSAAPLKIELPANVPRKQKSTAHACFQQAQTWMLQSFEE